MNKATYAIEALKKRGTAGLIWAGLLLIPMILVAYALLAQSLPQLAPPFLQDLTNAAASVPLWLVAAFILAGCLSFYWGDGLRRQEDWAPFVASIYFFHMGLYLALFVWLIFSNGAIATGEFTNATPWLAWSGFAILAFMVLASGFIGVWIFLHSPSILAGFEAKYIRQRPALPICPNLDCRAVLSGPNQECVRCNQDFVEATITLLVASQEQYALRFTRTQTQIQVSRYNQGLLPQDRVIYFRPDKHDVYASISAPHAEISYDGVQGEFAIIDLESTNKTYIVRQATKEEVEVGSQQPTGLEDGDTIRMGEAEFRFRVQQDAGEAHNGEEIDAS